MPDASAGRHLLVVFVALIVAACGGSSATATGDTSPAGGVGASGGATADGGVGSTEGWTPTETDALFALPLDAAVAIREPRNAWRFDLALDRALVECMVESGVDFDVPDRPEPLLPWVHERRYGVVRVETAQRWGYRPPPHLERPTDELLAAQRNLSPEATLALHGDDRSEGCLGRVGREIARNDDPRWSDFAAVEAMLNSTLEVALEEPEVAAQLAAWSDCVADRTGRRYGHPSEPIAEFSEVDPLGAEEISVAVADAECKDSTGLVLGWSAAESRLQQRIADAEPDTVASASALTEELLANSGDTANSDDTAGAGE